MASQRERKPSGKSRKQSCRGELTPAFRIGTVTGQAQVPDKTLREIAGSVGNVASFNCASGQLLKARGIVGQVTHKPHHQRVPTQAQLFEVNQVKDLPRKVSQQVIVQAKGTQGMQPKDGDGYLVKMCKQNCHTTALCRPNYSPLSHHFLFLWLFSLLKHKVMLKELLLLQHTQCIRKLGSAPEYLLKKHSLKHAAVPLSILHTHTPKTVEQKCTN